MKSHHEESPAPVGLRILASFVALPVIVILLPLILLWSTWEIGRIRALRKAFTRKYGPGSRGLLVYSNSPNWKAYIEQAWLPHIGGKLAVLNWSDRHNWGPNLRNESALFRRLGYRDFNPAAIVFKERSRSAFAAWLRAVRHLDGAGMFAPHTSELELIRFFKAFRDYKHGKDRVLVTTEQKLFDSLGLNRPTRDANSSSNVNQASPIARFPSGAEHSNSDG